LTVDVHVLVYVNRFLESWIASQMSRSLDYSVGKSIWVLIDMVESTGSWPGGYLCMYIEYYVVLFLLNEPSNDKSWYLNFSAWFMKDMSVI